MGYIGTGIRVQHLVLNTTGQVPTIPSPADINPSDSNWKSTDILKGEWAHNVIDDLWFYRKNNNTIATIDLNAIGSGTGGGLENRYGTVALMIAGQGDQTNKGLQFVTNASGDSTITSGYAYYEYLGTANGDLTDYRVVTKQEILSGDSIGLGKRDFEAGTTSPPSDQSIRYNNASTASVTEIYIDDQDKDGQDRSNAIAESTVGSLFRIITDESNFDVFKVAIAPVDNTGSFTIGATHIESKGTVSGEVSVEVDLAGAEVDISGKADKDVDAVEGNLAEFDANGNPVDAGTTVASFLEVSDVDVTAISDGDNILMLIKRVSGNPQVSDSVIRLANRTVDNTALTGATWTNGKTTGVTGVPGQISSDSNYIYTCIGDDQWERRPIVHDKAEIVTFIAAEKTEAELISEYPNAVAGQWFITTSYAYQCVGDDVFRKIKTKDRYITTASHPTLTSNLNAHDFSTNGWYDDTSSGSNEATVIDDRYVDEMNEVIYEKVTSEMWRKII